MLKPDSVTTSPVNRALTAAIGAAFVAFAVWIVVESGTGIRPEAVVGAVLVAVLGIEAIYSAVRGKQSLLMRIGPLP